ncbi:MAG TPA: hypothetical protein PLS49_03220 [Candidatus Woesebacteria bacterium]|nr:hypothetical protein [Candidatus Woesebacteria bacterium]
MYTLKVNQEFRKTIFAHVREAMSTLNFVKVQELFDLMRNSHILLNEMYPLFEAHWTKLTRAGQHFCFTYLSEEFEMYGGGRTNTFVGALVLPSGRFAIYSVDTTWYRWQVANGDVSKFDEIPPKQVSHHFHGVLSDPKTVPPKGYYQYGPYKDLTMDEMEFILVDSLDLDNTVKQDEQGYLMAATSLYVHLSYDLNQFIPEEFLTSDYLEAQQKRLQDMLNEAQ